MEECEQPTRECGYFMDASDPDPLNHAWVIWAFDGDERAEIRTTDFHTEDELNQWAQSLLASLR